MAHILIVDHERHILRLLPVNLERAGYGVRTVSDGHEALDAVRTAAPDLIVLATRMPGVSGYEVLEQLQHDPATRDIPVILLAWRCADADICAPETQRVRESGRPFLVKPFNPIALVQLVKSILNPGRNFGGSVIT